MIPCRVPVQRCFPRVGGRAAPGAAPLVAYPQSTRADGVDRTTALSGPWGSGSSIDVSDLDISAYITSTGWHEVALTSTTLGVIIAQVTTKALFKTV